MTFIHQAEAAPLVEAAGAGFEAVGSEPLQKWTGPMARLKGLFGLGGVMGGMVRFTDAFCQDGAEVLRRIGADALLVDQLEPGGALLAEHLRLPFATLAVAMPINREIGVPPPYVGWRFDPSERGLKRNRGGWRVTDLLMRSLGAAIERNARMLGLPPRGRLEECFSPSLQLSQMAEGLDFARRELPDSFHYVGPFSRGTPEPVDLPAGDDRPLVYCTLGTLQGSRASIFRRVAEACARLDLRLLITHGGLGDERPFPGNPIVRSWVPQRGAMAQADLVVCHGGMNSVLDAVAAGLPMVVMPLAFEQAAIAARLDYAGVAQVLSRRASAARLANAIDDVRHQPRYRQRALELQREIACAGGVVRAADLIEAKLT